jgi:hypothetical protein
MLRPYTSGTQQQVHMFLGTEIEHSACHGQLTLFVVGVTARDRILSQAAQHRVKHVFLGANQSFQPTEATTPLWRGMIDAVLSAGLWCTLDFDVQHWSMVMDWTETVNSQFVPMVSVKLPKIHCANANTVLKLDDADFDHSNVGVWCHPLNQLLDPHALTVWSQYSQDQIIQS